MISETNLGKIDGFKENHQKFIKPPSYEVMNPMVNLGPSFVNNDIHLKISHHIFWWYSCWYIFRLSHRENGGICGRFWKWSMRRLRTLMKIGGYKDTPLSLRLQVILEWLTILHWILRGLIVFEDSWDLSEGVGIQGSKLN